jgi:hypothetical protein
MAGAMKYGQRVRRIPLLRAGDGQSTVIVIDAQQAPTPVAPAPPPPPLVPEIAFGRDPVNAIVLDENLGLRIRSSRMPPPN